MISGKRARELDLAHHLAAGHAHALGGVAGGRVDVLHAGVGVGQDRRESPAGPARSRSARRTGSRPGHETGIANRAVDLRREPDDQQDDEARASARRAARWRARRRRRTPRPVCPISSPSGSAISDGDQHRHAACSRRARAAGRAARSAPVQFAGSLSQTRDPVEAQQPLSASTLIAPPPTRCHGVSTRMTARIDAVEDQRQHDDEDQAEQDRRDRDWFGCRR